MVKKMKEISPGRYRESFGRYYEEFVIGDVYEHRPGRTITQSDNIWFTLFSEAMPEIFLMDNGVSNKAITLILGRSDIEELSSTFGNIKADIGKSVSVSIFKSS